MNLNRRHFTPEQHAEIARRYGDGEKVAVIAADFGINRLKTIREIAAAQGVEKRLPWRPVKSGCYARIAPAEAEFRNAIRDVLAIL